MKCPVCSTLQDARRSTFHVFTARLRSTSVEERETLQVRRPEESCHALPKPPGAGGFGGASSCGRAGDCGWIAWELVCWGIDCCCVDVGKGTCESGFDVCSSICSCGWDL